ncbi:MAG: hypothetical protein HC802_11490 [Caldilineaceae bacterium]|nr:hypothetical protein [Caldilineaceae bacterium]
MTDNNRQQALIPEGAILIENPVGTAPGFIVEDERGVVIALPGVPREMKHLMAETVLPYLRKLSGDTGVIVRRVLRTVGIGESSIDHRISDLMQLSNPSVGLAAHTGQADVRITARAAARTVADEMLDQIEAEIRSRIGEFIYSTTPEETVETVVAAALRATNANVALLETNTQGAVARRLSAGVEAGAENPVVAHWHVNLDPAPPALGELWREIRERQEFDEALAEHVASQLLIDSGARYAVAILGAAGEDQGVFGRARGVTWFAVADGQGVVTSQARYGGSDEFTTVRLGNQALALLWNRLRAP